MPPSRVIPGGGGALRPVHHTGQLKRPTYSTNNESKQAQNAFHRTQEHVRQVHEQAAKEHESIFGRAAHAVGNVAHAWSKIEANRNEHMHEQLLGHNKPDRGWGGLIKDSVHAVGEAAHKVGKMHIPVPVPNLSVGLHGGNQFGGHMAKSDVRPPTLHNAAQAGMEFSGAASINRIRQGKGSKMDYFVVASMMAGPVAREASAAVKTAKAGSKMGIVAPSGKYMDASRFLGHSFNEKKGVFENAARSMDDYADYTRAKFQTRKYGSVREKGTAEEPRSVGFVEAMNPETKKRISERMAMYNNQLQRGRESLLDRYGPFHNENNALSSGNLPHPAHLTKEEFAASPYATFHATHSAPGLGHVWQGIHTGTAESAFDRMLAKAAFGGHGISDFRLIPMAMRGRVFDKLVSDSRANDWLLSIPGGLNNKSFHELTPHQINALRRVGGTSSRDIIERPVRGYPGETEQAYEDKLIDVVPYENAVEGPLDTSFVGTHPAAARNHIDLIRDYIAATGEIPRGLEGYGPHASRLLQQIRAEIARSKHIQRDYVPDKVKELLKPQRRINSSRRAALQHG